MDALQNPANIFGTRPVRVLAMQLPLSLVPPTTRQATYFTPYQMHASVGPSCGVADVRSAPDANGIQATIWSGTQGVYPLQGAIAQLLGISASAVHMVYVEASGCYGHNSADDAAADAAVISQKIGKPVRVQWMRQDEHGWEPLGPAMVHEMQGGLDSQGNVVAWEHTLWTQTHSTRPGGLAGNLLAGQELGFRHKRLVRQVGTLVAEISVVNYAFPNNMVTNNSVPSYTTAPNGSMTHTTNVFLRTSALRSLGGLSNSFANESFMDELAHAAGADPYDFRMKYLSDPRAVAVMKAMSKQAKLNKPKPGAQEGMLSGRGVAYLEYENTLAYVAAEAEVQVNPTTGEVQVTRVVVAHDCGQIINPDGLTNQIEGNVIQALSRTLKEQVRFDDNGVTSVVWSPGPQNTYPRRKDLPNPELHRGARLD